VDVIEATLRKLEGAMDHAEALRSARLVQADSIAAAEKILELITAQRDDVGGLVRVANTDVVAVRCDLALAALVDYTPLLGLIHRSKSSANPFEVYGPLLTLAQRVIQPDIRLVVSSEWDFSPFTRPHGTTLEGFVFVGMPATVLDKALLVPLAGHEFGHSVWIVRNAQASFEPLVFQAVWNRIRARLAEVITYCHVADEAALLTLEGRRGWQLARWLAMQQVEELFCDLVGLRLFGEAYLHAFAYLLAPGLVDNRGPTYPFPRSRAEVLEFAATRWGLAVPRGFVDAFLAPKAGATAPAGLLGEFADAATLDLRDQLIAEVESHAKDCNVALPRPDMVDAVRRDLAMVVPSNLEATLPELLCAGWQVRTDSGVWASLPHILSERHRVLDDLLLKSAQVLEYHERLGVGSA
jgi:hypothetical protein